MATLIQVTSKDGSRRRCDSRCYNATGEDCECVCGGRNHGAGLHQAVQNTREMAQDTIDKGVPDEYAWRCLAYDVGGAVCGRKAVLIDPQTGCPVCARHAPVHAGRRGYQVALRGAGT